MLFAQTWEFWGWTALIVVVLFGWIMLKAAQSSVGQAAGKFALWSIFGGK
jgi:hypothetical protein